MVKVKYKNAIMGVSLIDTIIRIMLALNAPHVYPTVQHAKVKLNVNNVRLDM